MPGMEDAPREVFSSQMNTASPTKRMHPMIIVAAGAVTLFCAVGIGVMTGLIPSAHSRNDQTASNTKLMPTPLAAGAAQAPLGTQAIEQATEPAKAQQPARANSDLKPVDKPTMGQPLARAPESNTQRTTPARASTPAPTSASSTPAAIPAPSASSERQVVASAPAVTLPAPTPTPAICNNCGVIESVTAVSDPGKGSGAGAVIGGVVGGVLGRQVGDGRGRDAATVAGAVGGAVLGNHIEKSNKTKQHWDIRVRLEDGTFQNIRSETQPDFRAGEKVKIENGRIVRV
jgi:outer membrane lipoprotein SlyB